MRRGGEFWTPLAQRLLSKPAMTLDASKSVLVNNQENRLSVTARSSKSKFLPALVIWGQLSFLLAANSTEQTLARSESVGVQSIQTGRLALGQFPEVVAAEGYETKDRNAIKQKAQALLAAKDYDLLEKLAGDLRVSKAAYVDGYWKLWAFYQAFGDLVWSKSSCGCPAVKFQQASEPLARVDFASGFTDSVLWPGKKNHIPFPLVVSFGMKMKNVIR